MFCTAQVIARFCTVLGGLFRARSVHVLRFVNLQAACTTGSGRNRCSVWASAGVTEKTADVVGSFWRENVLEFAGLLLDF